MTEYCITGIYGLANDVRRFNPDFILSIRDSAADERDLTVINEALSFAPHSAKIFKHTYDDVEAVTGDTIAPSISPFRDLGEAIYHMNRNPERVLVHCSAGVSRSSAATIFLMAWERAMKQGREPDQTLAREIIDDVYALSPDIDPNLRIVKIAECVLAEQKIYFQRNLVSAAQCRRKVEMIAGSERPLSW